MDKGRVLEEIQRIQEKYPVEYDLDDRWVLIHDVQYPEGWSSEEAGVLFKLSKNYPKSQPKAFIPERIQFSGKVTHRLTLSGPSGWHRWCIHRLNWEPKRHTLVTVLRLLLASLEDPAARNPFQNA